MPVWTVFVNYPKEFMKKATYEHEAIFINSPKQFQKCLCQSISSNITI